ncbi:hypothetical protein L5F37_04465 [Aliarcobacter butzleri]|uniref:hypothetical protein n=1 Tax=Aliarcobacter butzleri TaxID=28197 RepID=UPI001EDB5CB1|nr:hypothetical protein [Aliarcobacter butzleri]MCG3662650.1 hypothetical protein [Aliarcobacter butzleri]
MELLINLKKSFIEVFMSLIISTLPITIGSYYQIVNSSRNLDAYSDFLYKMVMNGELFLYSSSVMAPIIFITTYNKDGKQHFPLRWLIILITIVLFLIISVSFGVQKIEFSESIFHLSFWIFILINLLYFIVLIISNLPQKTPSELMKKKEEDFTEEYRKRRGA